MKDEGGEHGPDTILNGPGVILSLPWIWRFSTMPGSKRKNDNSNEKIPAIDISFKSMDSRLAPGGV
jgi:hypothetical protein